MAGHNTKHLREIRVPVEGEDGEIVWCSVSEAYNGVDWAALSETGGPGCVLCGDAGNIPLAVQAIADELGQRTGSANTSSAGDEDSEQDISEAEEEGVAGHDNDGPAQAGNEVGGMPEEGQGGGDIPAEGEEGGVGYPDHAPAEAEDHGGEGLVELFAKQSISATGSQRVVSHGSYAPALGGSGGGEKQAEEPGDDDTLSTRRKVMAAGGEDAASHAMGGAGEMEAMPPANQNILAVEEEGVDVDSGHGAAQPQDDADGVMPEAYDEDEEDDGEDPMGDLDMLEQQHEEDESRRHEINGEVVHSQRPSAGTEAGSDFEGYAEEDGKEDGVEAMDEAVTSGDEEEIEEEDASAGRVGDCKDDMTDGGPSSAASSTALPTSIADVEMSIDDETAESAPEKAGQAQAEVQADPVEEDPVEDLPEAMDTDTPTTIAKNTTFEQATQNAIVRMETPVHPSVPEMLMDIDDQEDFAQVMVPKEPQVTWVFKDFAQVLVLKEPQVTWVFIGVVPLVQRPGEFLIGVGDLDDVTMTARATGC